MERCAHCKEPLSLKLFGENESEVCQSLITSLCSSCIVKKYHDGGKKGGIGFGTKFIDDILNFKIEDERH